MNERIWRFRDRTYEFRGPPLLMGIVNVTPDSFSDGGQFHDAAAAVGHAMQLASDGAEFLDIGGESTRPGSGPVPLEDELDRVVPVIERLSELTSVPISVDTTKSEVARQSIEAGASIVNDISGLTSDPRMLDVCHDTGVGIVCMHIQGTPETMQQSPHYSNVVTEVCEALDRRLDAISRRGIPEERVVLDPGIGFGKTAEHNLDILRNIARFQELGRPILIGHSRKRFLKKLLGRAVDERASGSLGISIALAQQGVDLLRVHDVRATRDAIEAWKALTL
jgi:dihydropteroate synthase